jgi:2-polyprenyl-6-methoxyphenol hydroxylase-like FAD-dependent oxidoreductase
VLAELGLAERVAGHGVACRRFLFRNEAGRQIGAIPREQDARRFGWPLTMIRRGTLHRLLFEAAVASGVEILLGRRLVSVAPGGDGVRPAARFEDGSSLEGDLLVGCDGLRSAVRSSAFAGAPSPVFSGLWDCGGFVSDAEAPVGLGDNEMVFGRQAFFGAFRASPGEVWWFHNGPQGAPGEEGRLRERLLELHRDDPGWVRGLIEKTPEVLGPWPLFDLPDGVRWTERRACLIGDAAHAMSPSAGQGASLAMEDAMALAISLRDEDGPDQAVRAFERFRRPRVSAIARHARRQGSQKALRSRFALAMRDLALPFFLRLGGAAQDRSYGYRLRWELPLAAQEATAARG